MKYSTSNTRQCVRKNNLTLTLATEKDIETLRLLAYEIWDKTYTKIISFEQIEYMLEMMYNYDRIKNEIVNNYEWYLARADNEPIGFVSIEILNEGLAKLHKFYIKTEFQHMGIGEWVFKNLKTPLINKNIQSLTLNVNRFNLNAINAYLKYGFKIQKSIDIPYGRFILNDYVMIFSLVET